MMRSQGSSEATRPLTNVPYQSVNSGNNPFSTPEYKNSESNLSPQRKSGISNWIKVGIPVLVLVIVAAVVGGVVGSRSHKSDTSSAGSSAAPTDPSAAASIKNAIGRFPTATNSYYQPQYPSTTNEAAFSTPTFIAGSNNNNAWPSDDFKPANPVATSVRPGHPRIIAPKYKWDALPNLVASDPYFKGWNATIFGNATLHLTQEPVVYHMDGSSGILDNAREVKMRIKNLGYAYRMSQDKKYSDRAYQELLNAIGKGPKPFGFSAEDPWNTKHFLDVAEFTAAFAIGYDWMFDVWTQDQKDTIVQSILNFGVKYGLDAYNGGTFGWWRTVNGNWNCVCNSGLTMGALAIIDANPSGEAKQLLGLTIPNAAANCAMGPSTDGTWSETPNYWYFGTTGHAEMSSSLLTATGSYYNLLSSNPTFNLTALYHMHVFGMTSLFDYGDHGPNKFSTTANSLIFYGSAYKTPAYMLYQRDRADAAEPNSMFWYDPTVSGAFWDGLPLDHLFNDDLDQWAAMRSSWTDSKGLYVAMKAGKHTDHQTHNDLDAGDFVLDAMGSRWAGELGSGDYLSTGYFSSSAQDSQRWLYYRKRTEGQNTVVMGGNNQNVNAVPTIKYGSSGTVQGSSTVMTIPPDSKVFFTCDLTDSYDGQAVKRGVRTLNGRRQVLVQTDFNAVTQSIEWRMHTNATVTVDSAGTTAALALDGNTLNVQILNAPNGAKFTTGPATRSPDSPALPPGQTDQENPGVTVLSIKLAAGTYSLQVLFNPQWKDGFNSFITPSAVPIDSWSLDSHQ